MLSNKIRPNFSPSLYRCKVPVRATESTLVKTFMEEDNARYSGSATVKRSYMREFLVECPKCSELAVITSDLSYDTSNDKLVCSSCNHIEKADDLVRYNVVVKRVCDNCGKPFESIVPNNKHKVNRLIVPCPNCGVVRTYKPRNDAYRTAYNNSKVGDPIFNLPLWYQTSIKGEAFWAYNREHLNEIRNYVSAKLRERQTTTHTTMVEKLPNFIKSAKNRKAILKAIDKLMKK